MNMREEERQAIEEFLELVEEYKDSFTIVEGKSDKAALKQLGFTNVITLSTALYKIVEQALESEERKVIVLTDLDSEGKKLYSKLKHELGQKGIHIDDKLRNALFKTQLRQIEGLTTYLEKKNNLLKHRPFPLL
jgi:5S rRNA maturation endonuclease (ribonuclease M5)